LARAALVLAFLAVHLWWLPRTLEDLDSINFALGVRAFDVARHQPHPPGYPIFIALAKVSTAVLRAIGVEAAAPRGLAIWSAIGGALALPALLLFLRRLEGRASLAAWAVFIAATCPLFWFTALRPLSDMLGFAAAMWTLAILAGNPSTRAVTGGALLAGLAIGIRSQTAALTLPWLAYATLSRRSTATTVGVVCATACGVLAWAVPLIVASGGLAAYLHVLNFQAGADFEGVVMLWTHHGRSDVLTALLNTFVWPWDWRVGLAVVVLGLVGTARILLRSPRAALAIGIAFVPYAVFHLLFQETVTTRYALPLVPIVAYAALAALEGLPARAMQAAALGIAALSLVTAVPASAYYAREGAPVFRAFDDMAATAHGPDRDACQRAAAGRVGGADPAGTRGHGAAGARVADARHDLAHESIGARVVCRRPGAVRHGALRSARARNGAPIHLGLRGAAVCRRRASQRHRLAAYGAAELDARPRLVGDGGGRRHHGGRSQRAGVGTGDRVAAAAPRRDHCSHRRPSHRCRHGDGTAAPQ
jgi:hypothetical protein